MTAYRVKIRFNGSVSHVTVNASSAGIAKQLVQAQYGPAVTVLSVQRM
jgi:hypothetical protein